VHTNYPGRLPRYGVRLRLLRLLRGKRIALLGFFFFLLTSQCLGIHGWLWMRHPKVAICRT
jgi:hypothetical protein